jgi:hypothetical protein
MVLINQGNLQVIYCKVGMGPKIVMCMAQLQAVGQAKLGQSHSLTMALAQPEILESKSGWLSPWLLSDFLR